VAIDDERNIEEIVVFFDYQGSGNEGRMMRMRIGGDNMRKMKRRNMYIQKVLLEQTKMRVRVSPV
jgi:hypothetical protein